MQAFADYLSNFRNSIDLQSVCLDKNDIHDDGIRELMDGVKERFDNIEKENNPNQFDFRRGY